MKNTTKKIALWILATTALFWLVMNNVSAMYGNWQGQWRWMGQWGSQGLGKMVTAEERAKLWSMDQTERMKYAQELKIKYWVNNWQEIKENKWMRKNSDMKNWHNPSEMLNNVKKQDVNLIEINLLEKQYEEEMMANELYNSFYEKYWIETFKKISDSEAKHMEAVKTLLDRYNIKVPTNYDKIKDLYEELKKEGSKSAFDALEVGVKIEFVDIDDIITAIKATDNNDIKIVFTNIGGGSYNHLRGFLRALESNGYTTNLDWSKYLTESDLSRKGPIKYKLAEKLESEWVSLPSQVSSESMKKNYSNQMSSNAWQNRINWNMNRNVNNYQNRYSRLDSTKLNQYKNLIKNKYSAKIDALSNEQLQKVLGKIVPLLEKIKTSTKYSQAIKEKYAYVLVALKEVIEEKLVDDNLDIDGLLK